MIPLSNDNGSETSVLKLEYRCDIPWQEIKRYLLSTGPHHLTVEEGVTALCFSNAGRAHESALLRTAFFHQECS